ncbi:DNA helicase Pif1-like [Dillenia turbinata]|uniref:DNA helicase Pif1-like n=1 Tax=Dillenia turbinata TaxID=194707 RepID=A0AAN8V599_9MAGN
MPGLSRLMTEIDNHLLTSSIGVPVNSTPVSESSHNMNASVPSFICSTEAVPDNPSFFVNSSNPTSFGEGKEHVDKNGEITLPVNLVIPYIDRNEYLDRLISSVFPDLGLYSNDPYKMINRCIFSPKNAVVHELWIEQLIKDIKETEDFLNSQNPRGLPPYRLSLKENCPIMLLRNINPTEGLCNGTRLICRQLGQHSICVEIIYEQHKGKKVFIPRIPLQTSDSEKNGIPFVRTQFPIRLCFSMTINKSQGQTLDYVGIYLNLSFLMASFMLARSPDAVKVLIVLETFNDVKFDCKTRNVIFAEMFDLGTQVEGIMFNADIPKICPMLQLYKKYLILNAVVRPIPPKFQSVDLKTQWVISIGTLVEESNDGDDSVMFGSFSYTKFTDLVQYMNRKDTSVNILAVVICALELKNITKERTLSFKNSSLSMKRVTLSTWFNSVILVDPPIQEV